MKYRYKFNYDYFLIGENESFYEDMATHGWLLKKRGVFLSKFIEAEPCAMRYRVELAGKKGYLPKEQIILYEDSGWELITRFGNMYVFGSLKDSGAPEPYASTKERTSSMKEQKKEVIRNALISVFTLFVSILPFLFNYSKTNSLSSVWELMKAQYMVSLIKYTYMTLTMTICYILIIINMCFQLYKVSKMYNNFKKGKEVQRRIKHKRYKYVINGMLGCFMIFFLALAVIQFAIKAKYSLPKENHRPLVLLSDIGIQSGVDSELFEDRHYAGYDKVKKQWSLLSTSWKVSEHKITDTEELDYRQTVSYIRNKEFVEIFAESLVKSFNNESNGYQEIFIEGTDKAYQRDTGEVCVINGQYVYWFEFSSQNTNDNFVSLLEEYRIFNNNK